MIVLRIYLKKLEKFSTVVFMKLLICLLLFFPLSLQSLVLEKLDIENTFAHKKVGYFVGSFDPLHKAHEAMAEKSLELCDYVLVYPAWGGDHYKVRSPIEIRLDMLFEVFADHPSIIVTKLSPKELQKRLLPSSASFIGIIGSDTALYLSPNPDTSIYYMTGLEISPEYALHTWGSCMALPADSFIVFLRNNDDLSKLGGYIRERPICALISLEEGRYISSTSIKDSLKKGEGVHELVSRPILDWIQTYNMYQR